MKVAMFTNTWLPHVGGVARSIETLAEGCRRRGHEVRIVAPDFEGAEPSPEVLRVPSIQRFNGSDFCVRLPLPNLIRDFMEDFAPDLIHSHHPFLLGDAALREATKRRIPILFTHHTLYERYTHYVPLDSPALKRAAIQLATEYCNLCHLVIAPSDSIAMLLRERGVERPIEVVPTGIDLTGFGQGDRAGFRQRHELPQDALVIGHVGRLAAEKNLAWLAQAVAPVLCEDPRCRFLLVGEGESSETMMEVFEQAGCAAQVHATGRLGGAELAGAYAAIDLFAFSSQTETQGMVLAEAMAAATPVVALDGPGVREIVVDGGNGRLLPADAGSDAFAAALRELIANEPRRRQFGEAAREAAARYDAGRCVDEMLECYEQVLSQHRPVSTEVDESSWDRIVTAIGAEWDLLTAKLAAATAAVVETPATEARLD